MNYFFLRRLVNTVLVGVGAFWLLGCVDQFEPNLNLTAHVVTVEAVLSNLPEQQKVILKLSESTKAGSYDIPLTKATVKVVVNSKDIINLTETDAGTYVLPTTFQLQVGSTYQLKFTLSTGQSYESSVETMNTIPVIKKVYDEFNEKLFETSTATNTVVYSPGNSVYIDTDDPAGVKNYYQWNWTLWESQNVCASCIRGNFYLTYGNQKNVCVINRGLLSDNVYDYYCDASCWEIIYNKELNVMADTYSDGKSIVGRQVAKIPFYSRNGCLLEIRQNSLSIGAYRYLKLLADQSQNTGTLADTPPVTIAGNIRNVANTEEAVVGYFQATGSAVVRYWLDRKNAQNYTGKTLGLLGGRSINPEPMGADLTRPPFAPCSPTTNHTPVMPAGWH